MTFFKNKYRQRIEDKIMELYHERLNCATEAGNINQSLTPKEKVHYIILVAEYDKQIELLKSLL